MYHVQTEDSGLANPVVVTLLYYEGAILASKKTSYKSLLDSPQIVEKVQDLMKLQHKMMIKELIAGKHTPDAPQAEKETPLEGARAGIEKDVAAPGRNAAIRIAAREEVEQRPGLATPRPAMRQIKNSLDDILLDFILKKHKPNDKI